MSDVKYRLWVNRDGEPRLIECIDELDEEEARTVIEQFADAKRLGQLLILAPGWEVRSL